MTTKEFLERVEELGYEKAKFDGNLAIWDGDNVFIAIEHKKQGLRLSEYFYELDDYTKIEMFALADEYASTPIADRVEEEKFYWRVKGGKTLSVAEKYLWVIEDGYKRTWEFEQATHGNRYTQKEYDKFVAQEFIADIFEKEAIK